MKRVFPALFAEFFEFYFFFEFFLVASGKISVFFTHFASKFDEIFLRHNSKIKNLYPY